MLPEEEAVALLLSGEPEQNAVASPNENVFTGAGIEDRARTRSVNRLIASALACVGNNPTTSEPTGSPARGEPLLSSPVAPPAPGRESGVGNPESASPTLELTRCRVCGQRYPVGERCPDASLKYHQDQVEAQIWT
jgi:hypothetical protein